MDNLDNLSEISRLDKGNVYGSIQSLVSQVKQAWAEVNKIELPVGFGDIENIVLSGMGGSALAGRALRALFLANLKLPFEVVTNYSLPGYVNENSLVVLSSYSGNTAETISAFYDARNKKARMFAISTGGKLAELSQEKAIPAYIYKPLENPSGQPRMALGYSITALIALFSKLGINQFNESDHSSVVNSMTKMMADFEVRQPTPDNLAKKLALKLKNQIPVFVASDHLYGICHALKNQINENAKTFALNFDIPELNHHLLEGLKYPVLAKELYKFVFVESSLYQADVLKRFLITRDVIDKNEVAYERYELKSSNKVDQVYEMLVLGSFVSFYLAMLYGIDPTPIPWVDYFKKELEK